jgi:hypothetical protein
MVTVNMVLAAVSVLVVHSIAKEAASFVEEVTLVVQVWTAPVSAVSTSVATLAAHVILGVVACEASGSESCVDCIRGGEAVNRGLITC